MNLALLSGCTLVGPDRQTPTTELSAGFANANQPGLSPDPAHTRWWQGFEDQELERLVHLAVAGNPDLRIASARLREARALWDEPPSIATRPSPRRPRIPMNRSETAIQGFGGADRDRELYNAGFDAFWELDLFGRVRRSIEARAAERDAAEASLHDVLVSLLAEVARNYFELRGTQHQLAVASSNAENQRQTLDLTIARLEGGRGTALDTARARAQLDATRASIPPLEAAIRRAMHRLAVLTGRHPRHL